MPTLPTMIDRSNSPLEHTDSATVAAFLDGRLRGRARTAFVEHLAHCTECRSEVVQLRKAIGEQDVVPVVRRKRSLGIAVAIAAVLLVSIVLPRVRTVQSYEASAAERVRADELFDAGDGEVALITPRQDAAVDPEDLIRFVWRGSGRDAMYAITLVDSVGAEVWRGSVSDTSVALDDSVRLSMGGRYFWDVEVRRADGSSARSTLRSLLVK